MNEIFTVTAWLLSINGEEIPVDRHPRSDFQFEQIVELIAKFGTESQKCLAITYQRSPTESIYDQLLSIYQNEWCKVRAWGVFCDEVTFRINADINRWKYSITNFLLKHPMFKSSLITVETDKSAYIRKPFLNKVSYTEALEFVKE